MSKCTLIKNHLLKISSHPKYRAALFQRFPSLACASEPAPGGDATSTVSGVTTLADSEKAAA